MTTANKIRVILPMIVRRPLRPGEKAARRPVATSPTTAPRPPKRGKKAARTAMAEVVDHLPIK